MTDTYKIADHVVRIQSTYENVHRLCKDYRYDAPAELEIAITPDDIAYERERANMIRQADPHILDGMPASDGYAETMAVYRKLAELLLEDDIILFHGSVIAVDGVAYLFTAKSGTGKSTHTRNWRTLLGDKAVMVNDDKPLLHVQDGSVIAYGTPWNGKHCLGENIAVPLKAICILTRDTENHIEPISKKQAYAMILQQIHKSTDVSKLRKTLQLAERLMNSVELYQLGCNMDVASAEVAYNGMKGTCSHETER